MKYKYIDVFAGAGGLSLGLEKADFENKGFIENWKPAIETILKNDKDKRLIKKDITQATEKDFDGLKKIDVMVGGPSCQGFSMAGKRDPKDARNTLFMDYLNIVDITRPKICLIENVKGLYTMKTREGGFVYNQIVEDFGKRGYSVQAKILNSFNYNVPQKRQRVIIIAKRIKQDYKYPEPIQHKKYLMDVMDLPYEEDETMQHIYSKSRKQMKKFTFLKEGQKISTFGSAGIKLKKTYACTITKSGRYVHPIYDRLISVREAARIQTFPDNYMFAGSLNDMYGQIGNAVPVNMAYHLAKSIKKCLENNNG